MYASNWQSWVLHTMNEYLYMYINFTLLPLNILNLVYTLVACYIWICWKFGWSPTCEDMELCCNLKSWVISTFAEKNSCFIKAMQVLRWQREDLYKMFNKKNVRKLIDEQTWAPMPILPSFRTSIEYLYPCPNFPKTLLSGIYKVLYEYNSYTSEITMLDKQASIPTDSHCNGSSVITEES